MVIPRHPKESRRPLAECLRGHRENPTRVHAYARTNTALMCFSNRFSVTNRPMTSAWACNAG